MKENNEESKTMDKENELFILWTNADVLTSGKMVMMYATNSLLKNWWGAVTVIIWGATAKLAAENALIQDKLKTAQEAGVQFTACKACADQLDVTEKLEGMGIEVKYWGQPLTELLKENKKLITI
jgi:hypothetical protein